MDPVQQSGISRKSQDIQKAELERKSRDLYTAYNPTNTDQQVVLNAKISPEVWTIPAKSEAVVPNYVLIKYKEEMTDKIIVSKSDKMVIEENEKRQEKGFAKMDLHTEQFRFESRNLKNLMSKREKILAILDRGLYKEYGIGGDTMQSVNGNSRDLDSGSLIDNLDNPQAQPPVVPTNVKVNDEFKCECGKTFAAQIGLLGHQRSHKEPKKEVKVTETEDE